MLLTTIEKIGDSAIKSFSSERPASGQGEEEDRFDEVVASPNLQNLAARSISTLYIFRIKFRNMLIQIELEIARVGFFKPLSRSLTQYGSTDYEN